MNKPFLLALGPLMILVCATPGWAQTTEDRRLEEKARESLRPTEQAILEGEKRLVTDYGFWINHQFTDFNDDDNDSTVDDATSSTISVDPRFWVRTTLRPPADGAYDNEHSFYLRVKDLVTWREPANENGSFDQDGPHPVLVFQKVREIGDYQVHPRLVLPRELDAAVDDDDVVARLDGHHVLPNFTQPTQGYDFQRRFQLGRNS